MAAFESGVGMVGCSRWPRLHQQSPPLMLPVFQRTSAGERSCRLYERVGVVQSLGACLTSACSRQAAHAAFPEAGYALVRLAADAQALETKRLPAVAGSPPMVSSLLAQAS